VSVVWLAGRVSQRSTILNLLFGVMEMFVVSSAVVSSFFFGFKKHVKK